LTGLVFSYGLYGGLGYLIFGQTGFWCGAGLVTVLYGRQIWIAVRSSAGDSDEARESDG
jgi:hypothetical protein